MLLLLWEIITYAFMAYLGTKAKNYLLEIVSIYFWKFKKLTYLNKYLIFVEFLIYAICFHDQISFLFCLDLNSNVKLLIV